MSADGAVQKRLRGALLRLPYARWCTAAAQGGPQPVRADGDAQKAHGFVVVVAAAARSRKLRASTTISRNAAAAAADNVNDAFQARRRRQAARRTPAQQHTVRARRAAHNARGQHRPVVFALRLPRPAAAEADGGLPGKSCAGRVVRGLAHELAVETRTVQSAVQPAAVALRPPAKHGARGCVRRVSIAWGEWRERAVSLSLSLTPHPMVV